MGRWWAELTRRLGRAEAAGEAAAKAELDAVRSAGLDVMSELSLEVVLQRIVDRACELLGTRYGALAIYGQDGKLENFLTAGISAEQVAKIGRQPTGRGLLSEVLDDGRPLRLSRMSAHPRSVGLPAEHPPMESLLAVPIPCRAPWRGNLYLSETRDGRDFDAHDEQVLVSFALQAGIAVDNARLHARVAEMAITEERLRLAHELHDGQAQVLAYVNTKAQVLSELLKAGRVDEASGHLEQLAAAAREVYADVREGISGLRSGVDGGDFTSTLRAFLERWQDQSGIPVDAKLDQVSITDDVALQLIRVIQEALANVRKHAEANRVEVSLEATGAGLIATIEDDGIGLASQPESDRGGPRFGLATMRERCHAIGGELSIESPKSAESPEAGGTRVRIELPGSTSADSRGAIST